MITNSQHSVPDRFFCRSYYLFLFFFFSCSFSFFCPFIRWIHVKMALELLKYMRTCTKKKSEERKRDEYKQSSLLFFSIPFSRNSSLVYTHTHIYRCSINGYNISHAHTHARTYIIKRKKKKKKQS